MFALLGVPCSVFLSVCFFYLFFFLVVVLVKVLTLANPNKNSGFHLSQTHIFNKLTHWDTCFNIFQKSCLELTCSPLRRFRNNTCEAMYNEIRTVVYTITARLYPVLGWKKVFDKLHIMFDELDHQMKLEIERLLSTLNLVPKYGLYLISQGTCYFSLSPGKVDACYETPCCSQGSEHYEVEVRFKILSEWHDLDDIMTVLTELENIRFNLSAKKKEFLFRLQVRDFVERIQLPDGSRATLEMCNIDKRAQIVNLSKQRTCPLVLLNFTSLNCFENIVGLCCPTFNVTLNAADYVFHNSSFVSLCSNVYLKIFVDALPEDANPSPSVSVVMSLVCTVISLLCLLFSFVTFCLFPRLRTLPGKNTMGLIFALMVAQSMFLISSFGRFERGSVPCKTVGVLTHFSWLLAIFWMNVCTFHVFRIFAGVGKLVVESEFKTLTFYFVYTIGASVAIICLNICVSLLSSDKLEFGYGKSSCYISSENMVAFTFGIPVGFVIVANFIMFLIFVIKIKRTPVIKKDVKNERNDMIVFAKLSSLTGFSWIFGFIYSWTDIEVFSYLFIVLNALQGVFLFFSFVCNKRVFDMFQNRSFGVTATSEAYRRRFTDSQQSSSKIV